MFCLDLVLCCCVHLLSLVYFIGVISHPTIEASTPTWVQLYSVSAPPTTGASALVNEGACPLYS